MIQPTRTNLLLLRDRLRAVLNCTTILKGCPPNSSAGEP